MTERFKFSQHATDYEVLGRYGLNEKFIVTKFQPGAARLTDTSDIPDSVAVEALVSDVATQDDLLAELKIRYPDLTGFKPF
jgi:hypothetical protein